MLVGRVASISSSFQGMLVLSATPALALDDVSSHCCLRHVSFRSPCLQISWTCTGIRVCPSKVFPSATPARPTCPTSKGNTPVSSGKTKASIGRDISISFLHWPGNNRSIIDCNKFGPLGRPLCTLPLHHFIFSPLPVLPLCMGMLTVLDWNAMEPICIHSSYVWCFFFTKK